MCIAIGSKKLVSPIELVVGIDLEMRVTFENLGH